LRGNLLRHVVDSGKIGAAIRPRRCANANKNRIAEANGFAGIFGIGNFSGLGRGNKNFVEVLLVDGNLAGFQLRDAASINVRAHHVVARLGEARPGHQSNVTATNHR